MLRTWWCFRSNTEREFRRNHDYPESYGLSYSTVRHLIVCGHTECNTLKLLLASENERQENPFNKLMEPIDELFQATYRLTVYTDRVGVLR